MCENNGMLLLPQDATADDAADLDTGDEKDEVGQYEAWRERELQRIARDR